MAEDKETKPAAEEKEAPAKPKRPRGRPRKTPVASTETKAAPKKRGRPRKTPKPDGTDTISPAVPAESALADEGNNSAIRLDDTDVGKSTDSAQSSTEEIESTPIKKNDAKDDITVTKEAIIAKNSEETKEMPKKEGPAAVGGDDFYENKKQQTDWAEKGTKILFFFAYGIAAYFIVTGMLALTALRFILDLLDEESASKISDFMAKASDFLIEILAFLSGKSDKKPGLD